MDKIKLEKVGVQTPWDRIREARIRLMDIEKRVNVVLIQIHEKEGRLKYDNTLDNEGKFECQKDIQRMSVHLKALLRDL